MGPLKKKPNFFVPILFPFIENGRAAFSGEGWRKPMVNDSDTGREMPLSQ